MTVVAEILRVIKLVLVGTIIGGALWLLLNFTGDTQQWAKDYNGAVTEYNDEHWRAAVTGYERAWARHPGNSSTGRSDYAAAAIHAGDKAYEVAMAPGSADNDAEKGQTFEDALYYYERAQAHGSELNDRTLERFCDAYIQTGQYGPARKIIDGVKQKGTFAGSRFAVLETKIARYDK